MKPFNLEEAKAGKPVCTRDGRPARIVEFNMKDENFPIIAIVSCDVTEIVGTFTLQGSYYTDIKSPKDLMMVTNKREGWVNVYKHPSKHLLGEIFNTKKEAKSKISGCDSCVDTVKIEWKE